MGETKQFMLVNVSFFKKNSLRIFQNINESELKKPKEA